LLQALSECGEKCRSLVWRGKAEIPNDWHRWLLRTHGDWPCARYSRKQL